MNRFVILLPPSEAKAAGGTEERRWQDVTTDPAVNAFYELTPQREALIAALQQLPTTTSSAKLQKIFGVKGEALAEALAANERLPAGPLLPAMARYVGVMFDFIDYATLPATARTAFDRNVILFSGLWGLLRPADLIPDYKLKMDASLPGIGKVSTMWRPALSAALNPKLTGRVVWDLLPNAHAAAWKPAPDLAARWQVKFLQRTEKDGNTAYRTVSHWSKALKGALVRFICEQDVADPVQFQQFAHPQGYVFHPERSELSASGGVLFFVKE